RMNRLFALLAEGGVKTTEARHRLASHVLERDVTSFSDLSAAQVEDLITRLEGLKADGRLGAPAPQTSADDTQAERAAEPEGGQQ
ncbi:MAG: hypothetical protein ACRDQ1_17795, partial [Sciscionella sp.]